MFAPIAIVGRACVLPGALSVADLWMHLLAGHDLIGPVPDRRWSVDPARFLAASGTTRRETALTDRGGYVEGFDLGYSAAKFALPEARLRSLDPLVHWLMRCGHDALAEANVAPAQRARTGIVVGNLSYPTGSAAGFAQQTWLREAGLAMPAEMAPEMAPENRFSSGHPVHLAAESLRLGGDAFALDAACASSLYAIKLACDRLHDGQADIMLAGGINRADDLFLHIGFTALKALSPSGRSRPFHRDADGLLPAEGAGLVALKRLEDATAAGDRIFGVIRGIGLSNDGRQRGFLVPDVSGQVRAMRAAYEMSGLDPASIGYIECHATGTPVGDGVEIAGMTEIFGRSPGLAIGSLKSNLGHLITASGIAGLLKVTLAMDEGIIPPTLHADDPIEALKSTAFRLATAPMPWPERQTRRAAVNNFGFGGNNAHLIVEQYRPGPPLRRATATAAASGASDDVVVCGMGVIAGPHRGRDAFRRRLLDASTTPQFDAVAEIEIPLCDLAFPPNDLKESLPQQLLMIAAALEAVADCGALPPERTGIVVGMGADAEVARYGLRWRMPELLHGCTNAARDAALVDRVAAALAPMLSSAGVIGSMPNISANRLNIQFDWRGFGFTVSSEELSGLVALAVARRALLAGDIDAVVAGAVDLSTEPVHREAAGRLFPPDRRRPGDAAVALVLKRRKDAERDGNRIYAAVEEIGCAAGARDADWALDPDKGESIVTRSFGHAHAASGFLHVAAALLAADGGPNRSAVRVTSFDGRAMTVVLRRDACKLPLAASRAAGRTRETLRLRGHFPPVDLSALRASEDAQPMPPAPRLPPVSGMAPVRAVQSAAVSRAPAGAPSGFADVTAMHRRFIAHQSEAHRRFLTLRQRIRALPGAPASSRSRPAAVRRDTTVEARPVPPAPLVASAPSEQRRTFSRRDLEHLASGRISEILGPGFAHQDGHARQVRMPTPPLLLADRVTGLAGAAGSMGRGTIWTETDVKADEWYMHQGRMSPGAVIEAGQADLLLISWLGIDALNKGERVYRLLGCELTFHPGGLPKSGDTLRFSIHVDGHARTGGVRLFFFHYDCRIGDRLLLSVRNGQAGFFSDDELANSGGVLWAAAEDIPDPAARVDTPPCTSARRSFSREDVAAWVAGDAFSCFGDGFEKAAAHQRTPRTPSGRMQLIDSVPAFDPAGGPWRRGYLRAEAAVPVDAWFYEGHFKNDPCMPGTLMADAAVQALSLTMAALGFTIERDGWRFEPTPGESCRFTCRGQVTPDKAHRLTYEVFVEEIVASDTPVLRAALLCSCDGLKVFHCRRFTLQLVPDWPLSTRPDAVPAGFAPHFVHAGSDVRGDLSALIACSWGAPSDAFGSMYRRFDGARRVPRLPGPPYHFVSRVRCVDCPPGTAKNGASVVAEYRVPPEAWYFAQTPPGVMPLAVLMEVMLQPCGWLSSYMGFAIADSDLAFRNLDGSDAILHAPVGPDAGLLETTATLTRYSRLGDVTLVFYDVACRSQGRPVMTLRTSFGFFTSAALANQVGLPAGDSDRARILAAPVAPAPARVDAHPSLPTGSLRMIDAVTELQPRGGRARLGYIRGRQVIDPGAWYFKAHFFQDPVQAGSLGIEALVQLLKRFVVSHLDPDGRNPPTFEPIACGEALAWKYRGQVQPNNREVITELEIVRIGEEPDGALCVAAEGNLWVDGLRIYEVGNLVVRARPATVSRVRAVPAHDASPDLDSVRHAWRRRLGIGEWPVEALFLALVRRFVRELHVADAAAALLRGGPAIFLANHQVALESLTFAVLAAGFGGRPVAALAKREHAATWMGTLDVVCREYPGVTLPETLIYVDREDRASMLKAMQDLGRRMRGADFSLLIHAEGTRSLHCGRAVEQVSGAVPDLAVAANLPIIPVRFAGGLPRASSAGPERLDFPLGYAGQDVFVGLPVMPMDLATLNLRDRRALILKSLNSTGPPHDREAPNPRDDTFAVAVARLKEAHGLSDARAVVLAAIRADGATASLFGLPESAAAPASLDTGDPWLQRFYGWLTASE